MPELLKAQGHKCAICGRHIRSIKSIPKRRRLKITGDTVTYLDRRGHVKQALFATVEHLVHIRHGGGNNPANLIATCFPCNQ